MPRPTFLWHILSVLSLVVLKDHGMVPFIKIFLDDECYRGSALSILEQLSVINAEEYMSIIVGALCSSTQGELQLKLDLLKVRSSPPLRLAPSDLCTK